ncbi:MAG: hypothetical protein AAF310_03465 [Myxococcota bacterium]
MLKVMQGVLLKNINNRPDQVQQAFIAQCNQDQFQDVLGAVNIRIRQANALNNPLLLTRNQLAKSIADKCLQREGFCSAQEKLDFVAIVLLWANRPAEGFNSLQQLRGLIINPEQINVFENKILPEIDQRTADLLSNDEKAALLRSIEVDEVAYPFLHTKAQEFYNGWQPDDNDIDKQLVARAQMSLKGQAAIYIKPDELEAAERLENFVSGRMPRGGWIPGNAVQQIRQDSIVEGQQRRWQRDDNRQLPAVFDAFVTAFAEHMDGRIPENYARFFYTGANLVQQPQRQEQDDDDGGDDE